MASREMMSGKRKMEKSAGMEMKNYYGLLSDDPSKPCNLPTEVMNKPWPKGDEYHMGGEVDDLFRGVQAQQREDHAGMKRASKPGKY